MKIVYVTNMPTPYRVATWNAFSDINPDFTVLFCAREESNRIWGSVEDMDIRFEYEILQGKSAFIGKMDWGFHYNPSIIKRLTDLKPDLIIVSGYDYPTAVMSILYANLRHWPLVIWYESHQKSSRFQNGLIGYVRRLLMQRADGVGTPGKLAREHVLSMGVSDWRIFRSINTVNVDDIASIDDSEKRDGPMRFLFIGQFIERKNILMLIRAFSRLNPSEYELRLVGYGPQREEIESIIAMQAGDNIKLMSPTKSLQENIPHFEWADVLCMPSTIEVWGLVINEALAAGCAVMSSDTAGVMPELIEAAPINVGSLIDPESELSIYTAAREMIDSKEEYRMNRSKIKEWGMQFTPRLSAHELLWGVRNVYENKNKL